ncbi:hypothetical protein CIK04_25075, partial [Vibrio sp. 03_296]
DFCRALQFLIDSEVLVRKNIITSIDNSAIIANSAVIEDGVSIGERTIIEHNVTIHQGTVIGSNTIIRANSVIGAQGFGFEKSVRGFVEISTILGRVIIGNNVEIGALNSVCIGALDNNSYHDGC